MYILIVYNDFEHNEVLFVGIFNTVKSMSNYSNNVIRYSDVYKQNNGKTKKKPYKSKKSLFDIIRI